MSLLLENLKEKEYVVPSGTEQIKLKNSIFDKFVISSNVKVFSMEYCSIKKLVIQNSEIKIMNLRYNFVSKIKCKNTKIFELNYIDYKIENVSELFKHVQKFLNVDMEEPITFDKLKFNEELKTIVLKNVLTKTPLEFPKKCKNLTIVSEQLANIKALPSELKRLESNCLILKDLNLPETIEAVSLNLNPKISVSSNNWTGNFKVRKNLKRFSCENQNIYVLIFELNNSLEFLNCSNNSINSLYLVNCDKLTTLKCNNSELKFLELPESLKHLECTSNKFSSLKLTPNLKSLNISNNKIRELNVISDLECLNISYTPISKLIFSAVNTLKTLKICNTNINIEDFYFENLINFTGENCKFFNLNFLNNNLKELNLSKSTINLNENFDRFDKLISLNLSNTSLIKFPSISNTVKILDVSLNSIPELPEILPPNLESLDISYTLIEKLDIDFENFPKLFYLNISGDNITELPKITNKNLKFEFYDTPLSRRFDMEYKTLNIPIEPLTLSTTGEKFDSCILPKGTVLFRSVKKEIRINDFVGYTAEESVNSNMYYLSPHINVFFFPYPFSWGDKNTVMYVLTQDTKILCGVLPSKNFGEQAKYDSNILKSCDKVWKDKLFTGYSFDACISKDFMKEHSEVLGRVSFFRGDTYAHITPSLNTSSYVKYRKNFQDATGIRGVPEIVLHPLKQRNSEYVITPKSEVNYEWLSSNMYKYNYMPVIIQNDSTPFENVIDQLLSPEGYNSMHMTINLNTNFYMLAEYSDTKELENCLPLDLENKLSFW